MKLLVDVNLSPLWIGWLREAGFEAEYWSTFGANADPDSLILEFAREHSYVILTLDLDFGIDLADNQKNRPSVVQLRLPFASSREVRTRVILALREASSELEQGALVTISSDRLRIRPLPIR